MRSTVSFSCVIFVACLVMGCLGGCHDDSKELQRILSQRQVAVQKQTQQDHLGETVSLLNQFVELNEDRARQQIAYHLNQWLRTTPSQSATADHDPSTVP